MKTGVTVELVNVGMIYHRKRLFDSLNSVVYPGECLAITGRNGAGKSTLLKIIAGIVRPTAGKVNIILEDKKLENSNIASVFGFVSPEFVFYNNLSGLENLFFFCHLRGLSLTLDELKSQLKEVGLNAHFERNVSTYSTGMRQRLKFALTLALDPPLLLLDEPAGNLDSGGKEILDNLIRGALAAGKTVIIATNEAWEAEYACRTIKIS